jgi:hypothetical protein
MAAPDETLADRELPVVTLTSGPSHPARGWRCVRAA